MKSAADTARRLLGTLERFVVQESILLHAGHYSQMAALQRRAAPVIASLCQLGAEPGVGALGDRIAALLARRRQNLSSIAARCAFLRGERDRVSAGRQRLRRLVSYRRAPAGKSRLAATV
ncbi:MAG TPA: hypothetical protein VHV47_14180 [Opitutaceae bacterium]|jgi:hypothetical protein|nr:hypothetical protein [Opitutaceae bacterium]